MSAAKDEPPSFSREEFELMCEQSYGEIVEDTFQAHSKFGADMLLRHVKLKFTSQGAWGYTTFVYCPDGRVRIQRDLDKSAAK